MFYLHKRKQIRLKNKIIEDELRRGQLNAEEEREKALNAHLQPKPRVLPPFDDGTSMWKEDEPEEKINVSVDLDNLFYKRKRLNKYEIEFLIEEGYKPFSYKSICTNKKENYILKPRFNESLNHMIVIYDLAEYLNKNSIDHDMYTTRMPDIVMQFGSKRIALEVETGTVMSNMKKFREKIKLLNENYGGNWYFIVTNRNKVKKYKQYGKVIDLRYLRKKIDKIIKKG